MKIQQLIFLSLVCLVLCTFFQCKPVLNMKVLIRMMNEQEQYFKKKIITEFVTDSKVGIEIIHFDDIDSIDFELLKHKNEVGLVKVPFEKSWSLVKADLILPLEFFLSEKAIHEFTETYMLTSLGSLDGKHYFIPRKFETRLMVYLKSKVLDAVLVWRNYRDQIHETLKVYNSFGLPATYMLEEDPAQWDYFDIFVIGWIWSNTSYGGKLGPKIAHRGKKYSGTSHRVVDRVFQCNGDSTEVVSLTGDGVLDAFHWEAVYAAAGIYNDKMWTEKWSGSGVWKGFGEGEVFLSFMTQLDCFFIHGTGYKGLKGYLKNSHDFGVTVMPTGCSVEIMDNGDIVRKGTKAITTGGWWWGIPKSTPNPQASYKLARHITSLENQVQGCSRFGMIPVRKDVLSDMQMLFGGDWISEIYNVSFMQLMHNKLTIVPSHPRFNEIGNIYLDAWFDIVVDKNWSEDKNVPDREYIRKILNKKYKPLIDQIN